MRNTVERTLHGSLSYSSGKDEIQTRDHKERVCESQEVRGNLIQSGVWIRWLHVKTPYDLNHEGQGLALKQRRQV